MKKVLHWIALVSLLYAFFEFSCLGGLYLIQKFIRKNLRAYPDSLAFG
jgi:hypothetical protein